MIAGAFVYPPAPGVCYQIQNVYKSRGQYRKSMCDLDGLFTYDGAKAQCELYGMTLYKAYSPVDEKALRDYAISHYDAPVPWYYHQKTGEVCPIVVEGSGDLITGSCNQVIYGMCEYVDPALKHASYSQSAPNWDWFDTKFIKLSSFKWFKNDSIKISSNSRKL